MEEVGVDVEDDGMPRLAVPLAALDMNMDDLAFRLRVREMLRARHAGASFCDDEWHNVRRRVSVHRIRAAARAQSDHVVTKLIFTGVVGELLQLRTLVSTPWPGMSTHRCFCLAESPGAPNTAVSRAYQHQKQQFG